MNGSVICTSHRASYAAYLPDTSTGVGGGAERCPPFWLRHSGIPAVPDRRRGQARATAARVGATPQPRRSVLGERGTRRGVESHRPRLVPLAGAHSQAATPL